MNRLVVGTAGHIDHGKTSLVKALTGIDTDRLQEEKARGITIELGFAPLVLPNGQRIAFVDVPGHERLVRTMVAGAYGIDAVLLVIAADEGVMPQTREHLDILRLLGVRHGAVVLTKIDMVDEELLELAREDAREFVVGTFLEDAPVVACSAQTGAGLPELVALLERFGTQLEERPVEGAFRMPVDRVFTLRGFGTVVTGTVLSGRVKVGDTLEVCPAGFSARTRGVQVHGGSVAEAFAGQRVAVNLQGVDREKVARGHQLSGPGGLLSSSILDVAYEHLRANPSPLTHRMRIRFLCGTSEVDGVAHVLSGEEIEPGQEGYLQLRLDAPVAARAGDRFVLRLESPVVTLGGGLVLDPSPSKHRRKGRAEAAQLLAQLNRDSEEDVVRAWSRLAGPAGIRLDVLARRSGRSVEYLKGALGSLVQCGEVVFMDGEGRELIAEYWLTKCRQSVLEQLESFHRKNPLKTGVTRGELQSGIRHCGERVFLYVLGALTEAGQIVSDGPVYRNQGFAVQLDERSAALAGAVEQELQRAGLAAPLLSELREKLQAEEGPLLDILNYLTTTGLLKKIKEGYWVSARDLDDLTERMLVFMQATGELRPSDFKELSGLSRKWAIPLLEYFDKTQITLRVGDVRVLRTRREAETV